MDKGSKLHFGYKDEFFCFKVCDSGKLDYMIKQLYNLKCTISYYDADKKTLNTEDNFDKLLDRYTQQLELDLRELSELDMHQTAVTSTEDVSILKTNYISTNKRTDLINNINDISTYMYFIDSNLTFLSKKLTSFSRYLGKSISQFMMSFLLQPIKVNYNDVEHLVNVVATVYSSGNIIMQYSIPLVNIDFKFLSNSLNNVIDIKAFIPEYIVSNTLSYDYSTISYQLKDAFDLYNEYVLKRFNKRTQLNVSAFTNSTLVDYDGIPENFESMSVNLSRNIYWILNYPYGYFNEREKDEYKNFNKTRYSISNYASFFVSTNARSVTLYNKLTPENDSIKEGFTNRLKYEGALIYILPSIEMVLIKKSYYNMLSRESLNNEESVKNLRKKYSQIVDINNYLFSMRYNGYGSIGTLQNYLENNLTDFLPSEFLERNLEKYKEIIQIKESQSRENNSYLIALISMLFPILFGLDAIKSMLNYLECYFNKDLSQYTLKIWILLIILIISFLIRGKLIKIPFYIKKYINRYINFIKKILSNIHKNKG